MGRPKAWLPFGGEFMLQRVVRVVRDAVAPVVVVAAPGQNIPPLPDDVPIVRDEDEGCGPLAGMVAGLAALEGRADAAFLSGCDAPLLTAAFVRGVCEVLGDASIAVPHVDDHFHPLAAVYRISVLPHVRARLAAMHLRVLDLFECISTRRIAAHELIDHGSLRNLNTTAEYEAALRELAERPRE